MKRREYFELLASYNKWMNEKLYEAAGRLTQEELSSNCGAFFGSLLGTLNHIVVADTLWLKRFAAHPSCGVVLQPVLDLPTPTSLDHLLFADLQPLTEHRRRLDRVICDWVVGLSEEDLDYLLSYRSTKGVPAKRRYGSLMLHFFNHQTHHRGQASTLLSQAGVDIGVTDIVVLVPEEDDA